MEKEVIFIQKIAELLPVYQALFWALEIHQRTNCIRIPAFLETPFCLGLLFLLLLLLSSYSSPADSQLSVYTWMMHSQLQHTCLFIVLLHLQNNFVGWASLLSLSGWGN